MNIFKQAISDMFKIDDFLDEVIIEGELVSCWITRQEESVTYSDAGLVEIAPFQVTLKLPLSRKPKIGDKVTWNSESYKVLSMEYDSAMTTLTLHLETLNG